MRLRLFLCVTFILQAIAAFADGWQVESWIDITSNVLKNTTFDGDDQSGWTWESNAGSQVARCECMEFWNGTFNLHQTPSNLPKGKYRLSVQAYYRCGDNYWAYNNYKNHKENITAYLYAGKNRKKLVSIYSEPLKYDVGGGTFESDGNYFPNTMESARIYFDNGLYWNTMEFEAEGTIDIGLSCSEAEYSNWCIFDNFRLEYYGTMVHVSSIEVKAQRTELIIGETTALEAVVSPSTAIITGVNWSSSNQKVATVNEEGIVTAVGEGSTTITATAVDGSGKKGTVTIKVGHNKATAKSLVINEIMASNIDEFISPAFNFDGWVELYNPTDQAVELGGLVISETENNLGPWRTPADMGVIPAKGFRLIWFGSNDIEPGNAPFKLDVDGGTVSIAAASGKAIAQQHYPASKERVSYARKQDGTGEWGLAVTATPGSSNAGTRFATEQLDAPKVSEPSKLFSGSTSLSVSIPSGCTLRYTTDGTLPTQTNGQTSTDGHFSVSQSSVYRFRLYAEGKLPSRVTTRSYIRRDKNYTLPVVSVVTDPDFLYSKEIGVMAQGPNGRPGNGQSAKCNWNMNWERPVNFSYLTSEGEMALNQDVNLEMSGGWSRAYEPHSFKLKGNKELGGEKHLSYPFFGQKPYIRNRTLQIRNGGNDTRCRFKDPSLQYIIETSGLNIDCQGYQPVHEFINDKYIGVLNMREPNNKHFVYANYGWDDDKIDQFEMSPDSGYVQKCGTPDAFTELVDVLSPNAADTNTYTEICRRLDIDSYTNYMALLLYLDNWDWPQNNVKGFRHRQDGPFRFVVFDLDHAFSGGDPFNTFWSKEEFTFDQLYPSTLSRIRQRIRFVTLFKNMLKNSNFRRKFIDAFCIIGGSVLEKRRSAEIIDKLLERVEPAMKLETIWTDRGEVRNSANETASDVKYHLEHQLDNAIKWLRNEPRLQLTTTAQRVTLASDCDGATLFINDQKVPTGKLDGYLYAPVTLRTQAPAGYTFKGWVNGTGRTVSKEPEISLPSGTVNLTASFEAMTATERQASGIAPVSINEVSGANNCFIDEYGKRGNWIELYNTTGEAIDTEGMYLSDDMNNPTKYQITKSNTKVQTVIPAYGHLVIWCDGKRTTTDNGIHATFKIGENGGALALTAKDQSWTDVFKHPSHDANHTIIRFPEGCKDVYTTNVPTIGRSNQKTSYMKSVSQNATSIFSTLSDDSEFSMCYGSGTLFIQGAAQGNIILYIYASDGRAVVETKADMGHGSAKYDVSTLAPGLYIAIATNESGRQASCKFVR